MIYGFYLIILLSGTCLFLWPEDSIAFLLLSSYKLQIYWINWRTRRLAYKQYRALCRLCEENDWPLPGPFRYVNIWDRDTDS